MGKTKLKKIDEAWLGLDSVDANLFNPMSIINGNKLIFNTC